MAKEKFDRSKPHVKIGDINVEHDKVHTKAVLEMYKYAVETIKACREANEKCEDIEKKPGTIKR